MIGSIISGALGLGSAVAGSVASTKNTKRYIAAQSAENEKARAYDAQQAAKANEWNLQQWSRNNEYNDPSNQMKRLRAAGLNENLAYGSLGQNAAASAAPAERGSYGTPLDYSPVANQKTFGSYLQESVPLAMASAQIRKTNAETKSIETSTTGQESTNKILASDASFRDALNSNSMDLGSLQINNTEALTNMYKGNLSKLRSEVSNMDANTSSLMQSIEESRARVSNMTIQQMFKRLEIELASKSTQAQISRIAHENRLTSQQVVQMSALLPSLLAGQNISNVEGLSRIDKMRIDKANAILQGAGLSFQNEKLNLDLKNARAVDRSIDAFGEASDLVRVLGEMAKVFLPGIQNAAAARFGK